MRRLLAVALREKKHRLLLIFTIFAMILMTLSSQLEIFAVGLITRKGPDFFELFAPEEKGRLVPTGKVTHEQLENRWRDLDSESKGTVDLMDANRFLSKVDRSDFLQKVIDKLNQVFSINDQLGHLAIFLVVVALFKAITLFAHRYAIKLVAIRISCDLRQQYFEHIQALPMRFYQQHNIGSLSSRVVGDAALVAEAINACLINYMQTPFTVVSTLALCFLTSWQLSLMIFLGFPCIIIPIVYLAKHVKRISKQIQQNQERFASVLIDFLAGIQTVKVFAMEAFSLKKYREQNQRMAQLEQKGARYDLSSRPVVHTIAMFFLATSLVYGLYVLHMNVSEVLFYSGLLYIFYEPVKKFAEENSHIQRGIAAADRMFEVLDLEPQIQDEKGAIEIKQFNKCLEFRDVWFRYSEPWVLKGVSFTVERGQTVAIVGPTGAGKSSIVQLIPRLYEVDKGEILIDGLSIRDCTQKSLRELVSFVPQRPFLFLDTVADNIAYGQPYTIEAVTEAAIKAHADEFIRKLPEGYQTQLSEMGKNLSGGQQQRLAIARALFKDAPILIMDEATSALDTVSENQIKQAIHQLRGHVTQIIIAHRLSTIEDADKIIYIENGVKVSEGTKSELLTICPGFRLMWEMMHHQKAD